MTRDSIYRFGIAVCDRDRLFNFVSAEPAVTVTAEQFEMTIMVVLYSLVIQPLFNKLSPYRTANCARTLKILLHI